HAVGEGPSATLRGPPPLRRPTTVSPPTRTRPWRVWPRLRVRRKKGGAPAPRGGEPPAPGPGRRSGRARRTAESRRATAPRAPGRWRADRPTPGPRPTPRGVGRRRVMVRVHAPGRPGSAPEGERSPPTAPPHPGRPHGPAPGRGCRARGLPPPVDGTLHESSHRWCTRGAPP